MASRLYHLLFIAILPERDTIHNPCIPSPCGANAICREKNGAGSCMCQSDYIGNPYEGCRPECVQSSECSSIKTCIKNKCVDPCPGTCGQNAICQVINHVPTCSCNPGYTGDPYRYCSTFTQERKNLIPNILSIYNTVLSFSCKRCYII